MQGKPPAALGCGAYVAGVAAAVALLGGSPDATVTAVAVAGFCLGIVAGGLVVTRTRLLGHRVTARFTAGALVGLGVWVTWTGLQSGGGSRYQFAIGSVFLAVVGWAVLTGGKQATEPAGEPLASLPRTATGPGSDRRRWLKLVVDSGLVLIIAYFGYRAVVQSDPYAWLYAGLFLVVFLPGTRSSVRLTADGLDTTRYVFWLVPFDQSRTPWVELYGYEATDDRLRIATEFGRDITYATDSVDDLDGVVGVLDDHLPRL